jgi:hypothetical protein
MNRDVCEHFNPVDLPCDKCTLQLANTIEEDPTTTWGYREAAHAAAAELRRLHAVNEELLEALKNATDAIEHWGAYSSDYFQQKWDLHSDINAARAAIDRAEGKI